MICAGAYTANQATVVAVRMETDDVTLTSDDLRRLSFAIGLGRAAMHTVDANIYLSIGIKLVFLALVLMGMGTMWMAVLADVGTSLLVTLNGMRLLGYRASAAGGSDMVSTRRSA